MTSYNLVQLSAEELVENNPFEELEESGLEEMMDLIFWTDSPKATVIDFFHSSKISFYQTEFEGFQREIPPPPPDSGYFFS